MPLDNNPDYLLDTNTVSHLLRGDEIGIQLRWRMAHISTRRLAISVITEAELLYGLAKKPKATHLRTIIHRFLADCDSLPWNSVAARSYADLRAQSEANGISIASLDMLIAAHAHSVKRILITRDNGLLRLKPWVSVDNWPE